MADLTTLGNGVVAAIVGRRLEDFRIDGPLSPTRHAELVQYAQELNRRIELAVKAGSRER